MFELSHVVAHGINGENIFIDVAGYVLPQRHMLPHVVAHDINRERGSA